MSVEAERARRAELWNRVLARGESNGLPPQTLSDLGLRPYRTVQGIFRDLPQTSHLAPNGVTLSILFTGQTYEDTFDDESGLYHYPSTNRPGRDRPEVEATQNARRLHLPLFALMPGQSPQLRAVRLAWVEDWDDVSRVFLISFGARPADQSPQSEDFTLNVGRRAVRLVAGRPRPGQARFRFSVFKRYGPACALCGLAVPALLEAVHLCGVAHGGSDDPRNGLVLCCNHHRAFDERLFGFAPSTTHLEFSPGGPNAAGLGISVEGLDHLAAQPHAQALDWCWQRFRRARAEPTVSRDLGDH